MIVASIIIIEPAIVHSGIAATDRINFMSLLKFIIEQDFPNF